MDGLAGAEFLTPAGASVAALIGMRVGGLMWVAPVFSARVVPMRLRPKNAGRRRRWNTIRALGASTCSRGAKERRGDGASMGGG